RRHRPRHAARRASRRCAAVADCGGGLRRAAAVACAHRRGRGRCDGRCACFLAERTSCIGNFPPDGRTMKRANLVMVGNGMAGCRTLEELLKIAPDLYRITVFGSEPHPNYNRILLSPVLAGEMSV